MVKGSQRAVQIWLYLGCLMVFAMIIIGGITRLTGSGLSMTEWNVIMGTIPPMNPDEWIEAFEKYKQFPQYKLVNKGMSLNEFKGIFFWEYFHRLWGRLIGIVFFIPFIIFLIQKRFKQTSTGQLILLMFLGALQGGIGWYMVKSGLVDKPWVSHYRLAIHLMMAITVYSYTLYLGYKLNNFKYKIKRSEASSKALKLSNIIIVILGLQLFYGALMAGLKAGLYFPTYPTMNGEWIPSDLFILDGFFYNLTTNKAMVHLFHRGLPIILGGIIFYFLYHIQKNKGMLVSKSLNKYTLLMAVCYCIQFALGIITVINCQGHIPVELGVIHQGFAIVFLTFALLTNYRIRLGLTR